MSLEACNTLVGTLEKMSNARGGLNPGLSYQHGRICTLLQASFVYSAMAFMSACVAVAVRKYYGSRQVYRFKSCE
eukprot:4873403-Amphidinium_carterae.1